MKSDLEQNTQYSELTSLRHGENMCNLAYFLLLVYISNQYKEIFVSPNLLESKIMY